MIGSDKSLRIGIDARFATRSPLRGIGNYSVFLIRMLVSLAPQHKFILYVSSVNGQDVLPKSDNVIIKKIFPSIFPLWEQLSLPIVAKRDNLDILHCLGNTGPLWKLSTLRLVLSLHDVIYLHSEKKVPASLSIYGKIGRYYRRFIVPRCASIADVIVTLSEFSKQDILSKIPNLKASKIHVTYMSCDPGFGISQSDNNSPMFPNARRKYLLALGAEDPRKNTLTLVRSYLFLLERYNIEEDLIIVGYSGWEKSESYKLVKTSNAQSRVKYLSFVTHQELKSLYRNAVMFVYPSMYEGFGVPLLESFHSGCPVITSNQSSIPEVADNAALYVDPGSYENIAMTILRLRNDRDLQKELSIRGYDQAISFTWNKTAQKILDLYEEKTDQLGVSREVTYE